MFRKCMVVVLVCSVVIGSSPLATAAAAAPCQEPQPRVEVATALADYFHKVAGLGFSGAVLAAKGNKILFRNGYGWADQTQRLQITPETVFDIGSITKVFTAVAIMQLEERGQLSTSDRITKYFANVPPDKVSITLHQLLTHTSGLEHDDFYSVAEPAVRDTLKDRETFIQSILGSALAF